MRKKFILPVLCALITACSSPLLEWIETEPDTSTRTGSEPETTPPPQTPGIDPYNIPSSDKAITFFSFGYGISVETDTIRESPSGGNGKTPITVILSLSSLPLSIEITSLTPTIEYIGKSISPGSGETRDFSSPVPYRVTAENGSSRDYEVTVIEKAGTHADIIWFDIELPETGYMAEGLVDQDAQTVTLHVPSGTPLTNLTAKIVQTGKSFSSSTGAYASSDAEPEITLIDNFSSMVTYTVKSEDSSVTKYYEVEVIVDKSTETGIDDFKVFTDDTLGTEIPNSYVVIGQKPRPDGKIPIIIQVPNGTDEVNMWAKITLKDSKSTITHPAGSLVGTSPVFDGKIVFGPSNDREALYTVTAEDNAIKRDYVAMVSESPQYYYVNGVSGNDNWPDYYNGGSESYPFKTLAYAVKRAAQDGIEKVLITGDLTPTNGGTTSGDSAFAIDLSSVANKEVTIASSASGTPRTLFGGVGQRVLSITGGAELKFEDINITGGNTAKIGGGIYVTGNSEVDFSGDITNNTARSGGGVYVEAGTGPSDMSVFNLTKGTISDNIATGAAAGYNASNPNDLTALGNMDGGGGVYIKGNALFMLNDDGTISGNKAGIVDGTGGAGGGVLVNGNVIPGSPPDEFGLVMMGGQIVNNESHSGTYPHGGGGVYVAHGAFDMFKGKITGNDANRQGGGVFVHWGDARFTALGNSTITGNVGVGSSKDICNRGTTELIGSAQADYVYVWNYDDSSVSSQSLTVGQSVQIITGIALAYSVDNRNFIELADNILLGSGSIKVDLESRLINGLLHGKLDEDWLHKTIIKGANQTLKDMVSSNRLVLNTFTGEPPNSNMSAGYKIDVSVTNAYGTFEKKP
ncbi:MAG: hypothetical protein LBK83_07395 [Treponema sp.]|jgi:hypothetical protein|nr:hypothetical protein [Treponema sp.]